MCFCGISLEMRFAALGMKFMIFNCAEPICITRFSRHTMLRRSGLPLSIVSLSGQIPDRVFLGCHFLSWPPAARIAFWRSQGANRFHTNRSSGHKLWLCFSFGELFLLKDSKKGGWWKEETSADLRVPSYSAFRLSHITCWLNHLLIPVSANCFLVLFCFSRAGWMALVGDFAPNKLRVSVLK